MQSLSNTTTNIKTRDDFKTSSAFVYVLVGLLAAQPLTSDLYLPSLPSLTKAFAAPTSLVTWTLSVQVATFGITQLFMGPLADRFGRRPVALAGMLIYLIASIAAMMAPFIEWLIVCRALQGLGVACAYVTSRAMVRDLFEPQDGARALARGLMIMSLAPIAGPLIGGLLTAAFGWQGPFMALVAFSAVMALLLWRCMPETHTQMNPQATHLAPLLRNYKTIARHRVFFSYNLLSTFSYAGLFTFLSGSSFVFINIFGLSSTLYGMAFGCTGLGYLSGTYTSRRLIARLGFINTVRVAAACSLLSGTALLTLTMTGVHHPLAVLLPCVMFVFSHGILQPCAQSACTAPFAQMAGAASALNGFSQMLIAVFVGAWMGASFNGTTLPMSATMFVMSVCVFVSGYLLVSRYGHI